MENESRVGFFLCLVVKDPLAVAANAIIHGFPRLARQGKTGGAIGSITYAFAGGGEEGGPWHRRRSALLCMRRGVRGIAVGNCKDPQRS